MLQFPLQTFLLLLEQHGFAQIGIAERRRLQQLLETEGEYYIQKPDQLKFLLVPIFAKNPAEQERLYALFDSFWSSKQAEAQKIIDSNEPLLPISTTEVIYETLHRYRYALYALLVLLGLNIAYFVWQKTSLTHNPTTTATCPHPRAPQNAAFALQPNADTILLGSPLTLINQTPPHPNDSLLLIWQIGDTTFAQKLAPNAQPNNTPTSTTFERLTQTEGSLSISLNLRYAADTARLCPDTTIVRTLWVKKNKQAQKQARIALPNAYPLADRDTPIDQTPWTKYMLYWLLLLGLGIAIQGMLRWLRALNQYQPPLPEIPDETNEPDNYSAPYHLSYPRQVWILEPFMYDVANAMRQREASERRYLDLRASVRATAQQAGMPTLVEKHRSQPVQYLALIDSACRNDHQAAFFEQWIDSLAEQDVLVEKFVFRHDLRTCVNAEHPNGISLQDLYQRMPLHKLLVLSDGNYFINTLQPKLHQWLTDLFGNADSRRLWKQRALITPRPIAEWDYRERLLANVFSIVPANPEGQLMLVELLANQDPSDFRRYKKQLSQQLLTQTAEQLPPNWYETFAENPNFDAQDNVPTYLKIWLAAVALHPEPTYEVLMAMGKALQANPPKELGSQHQAKAPDFSRMLPFARIDWLRSGKIPTKTRRKLQSFLQQYPNTEAIARKTVIELLKGMNLPPNSLAYYEHKDLLQEHQKNLHQLKQNKAAQLEPQLLAYIDQQTDLLPEPPPPFNWRQKLQQWSILKEVGRNAAQYLQKPATWLLQASIALLLLLLGNYVGKQMGYIQAQLPPKYVLLNNQAVQLLQQSEQTETLNNAQQKLQQAQQLKPDYPYAQHNLRLIQYLRATNLYADSTRTKPQELQTVIDLFKKAANTNKQQLNQNDTAQYLPLHALHAAGVTYYYAQQPDTAQAYYQRIQNADSLYFEQIAEPNLATLLQQKIALLRLTDAAAKLPLDSVAISIDGQRVGYTQSDGMWYISPKTLQQYAQKGTINLSATKKGYLSYQKIINLNPQNQAAINISLQADPKALTANTIQQYQQLRQKQQQQYQQLLTAMSTAATDTTPSGWNNAANQLWQELQNTERQIQQQEAAYGKQLLQQQQPAKPTLPDSLSLQAMRRFYAQIGPLSDDRVAVKNKYGKWGYANQRAQIVVPFSYTQAGNFKNKQATVTQNQQTYTIDPNGKCIANCKTKLQTATDNTIYTKLLNEGNTLYAQGNYTAAKAKYEAALQQKLNDPTATDKINKCNTMLRLQNLNIKMLNIPGRNFQLSETEVTIGQYLAFCKATNSHYPEWLEKGSQYNIYTGTKKAAYGDVGMSESESNTNYPITGVSALDADAFCEWMGGRLPTEQEWEYAAKGGDSYEYAGSNNIDDVAWYNGNSGDKCHPVKQKQANGYGLYDMSGNVWEWTSSTEGPYRVLRGGSWYYFARFCRVAKRNNYAPGIRNYNSGFRLVLVP